MRIPTMLILASMALLIIYAVAYLIVQYVVLD